MKQLHLYIQANRSKRLKGYLRNYNGYSDIPLYPSLMICSTTESSINQ